MRDEEQYDVFISHSSKNRTDAELLVAGLERRKLKCWIAPRNLMPGVEYGAEIIRGIKGSKALIVLLSADAVSSRAVRAEVERAASMDKLVIPIAIEEVTLSHGLEFFLSLSQRVDLFDGPKEAHIDRVSDMIKFGLAQPAQYRKHVSVSSRAYSVGGLLAGIVIFAAALVYFYWGVEIQGRQSEQMALQLAEKKDQKRDWTQTLIKASEINVQKNLDKLLSRNPVILDQPNISRKNVTELPNSNPDDYVFSEVNHIWDMRGWRKVDSVDLLQPTSPVTVVVEKKLTKLKETDKYITSALTSGYDVYTRCDSHPGNCVIFSGKERVSVGGSVLKKRTVVIDTTKEKIGDEFYVKYTRTFWNAFQNSDQSWVGIIAGESVKKISFLIVFPDRKIFNNPRLMVAKLGSQEKYEYSGDKLVLGNINGRWMYWEILNPLQGYVYRIDWDWMI